LLQSSDAKALIFELNSHRNQFANSMKRSSLAFLFFLSTQILFAQTFQTGSGNNTNLQLNTITTAVPFLMISGDPQQMSLGDVGVVSSDMYQLHLLPMPLSLPMDKSILELTLISLRG